MSSLRTTCETIRPREIRLASVEAGRGDLAADSGRGPNITQGLKRQTRLRTEGKSCCACACAGPERTRLPPATPPTHQHQYYILVAFRLPLKNTANKLPLGVLQVK